MNSPPLRPAVRFLSETLCDRILDEAREVLREVGVEVGDPEVIDLLLSGGATKDPSSGRVHIGADLVDRSVESAPGAFTLHDRDGAVRADLGGMRIHFTPGSAAITVLDESSGDVRPPVTRDYVRYARLVEQLPAIDYPSTALIPSDVPQRISDSYRLYLSLVHGAGPVVTGAFSKDGMEVMAELLLAVRGSAEALAEKPLAIFSCCATAPLRWPDLTARNVVDCARRGIPIELISMPMTGFVSPGTLVGTLVHHTAENLSGLAISQLAAPGASVLWGGSPAIFDYRYETTPVGAIETQMIDCAYAEIGKRLGLPTQAYIALSDTKRVDAQAGLETAIGALLAALAGINSISGPGMLDFESCQSLEKLVVDHEICAMVKRLVRGVEEREGDFPAIPHFRALLEEGHSLIADHTRRWIRREVLFPGPVIDRMNRSRYAEEGAHPLDERARKQVEARLEASPNPIDPERRRRLDQVMTRTARSAGMDRLPAHDA
jgi:trimethylamine--corrinoid protein Co-methyltransferase